MMLLMVVDGDVGGYGVSGGNFLCMHCKFQQGSLYSLSLISM
jgi:hypothetical protein